MSEHEWFSLFAVAMLFICSWLSEQVGKSKESTRLMKLAREINMPTEWCAALFLNDKSLIDPPTPETE